MADIAINMQTNDEKAFNIPVFSPTMIAFHRLLAVIAKSTDAELRLEKPGVDVCSTAFGDDLQHADAVREALIETAFDVIATPASGEEDRGLHRMAGLLVALFQKDSSAERRLLHAQSWQHRDVFDIPGTGFLARQARGLQIAFFHQYDALAEMREFGGPGLAAAPDASMTEVPDLIPA